jgi:ubiquinone/menaquinone biosynthesis C-methylase UbiE
MSLRARVIAALYDRMTAAQEREGLAARRRELLANARGRVLEVGAGTGINLEYYAAEIEELVLVEPEPAMVRKLERRVREVGRDARIEESGAEALPFPDDSFDAVVCTLVLCSVDDPRRALDELRRVLRPGGSFFFLEHVRSDDPRTARLQNRVNPIWHFVANGCNCNRPTLALIEGSFAVDQVERGVVPRAPRFARPLVSGRALASKVPVSRHDRGK